jgi:rhamnosyltransferase
MQAEPVKVIAVVVIYQPQSAALSTLLQALAAQQTALAQCVIVDNGCDAQLRRSLQSGLASQATWLQQVHNVGLASGLNTGIRHALAQQASHVLLFDQDSQPAPDMLGQLLAAEQRLLAQGMVPAALGPVYRNAGAAGIAPIIGPRRFYSERKFSADFADFIEAGYLITSGQLIRRAALASVGLMRDDLFIDAIDIEWGLRASACGFKSYAVTSASMQHHLGDSQTQIGSRQVSLHSPLRHYYIIRNSLLLLQSAEINWRFKCGDLFKTLRRLLLYPMLCPRPWDHIRAMSLGLWHGIRGRSGPR